MQMPEKKPGKFSRLAMPKKPAEEMDLSSLDEDQSMPEEGTPEEEAAESPEEEKKEMDEGEGDHSDILAGASDEELMAELKKRGLDKQMDAPEEDHSQEQYS